MNKIILIGGAPTIGKSFAAKKLSEDLSLPWISTDTIREMMRKIVSPKDYPDLFHRSKNITAEKYLSVHSPKQIVEAQNKESHNVWQGVKALIATDYVWGSFIIEGVAILPALVGKLKIKDKKIRPIFIFDDDEQRIRKTIYTRGLWDDADKYSDKIKEVEVVWVMLFNAWIKKEASRYRFPLVKFSSSNNYFKQIKSLI